MQNRLFKKNLDFIVIGVQKGGTTSLHNYLSKHPNISLPFNSKEAPFFSNKTIYEKGFNNYLSKYFEGAPNRNLWGKISPQYMCNSEVAPLIKDAIPDVKIIALLRNPIDRAFSHFQMSVSRGLEKRKFNDVVDSLLQKSNLEYSRSLSCHQLESEVNCYLTWGEYYRILSFYLEYFDKKSLLIIFSEELYTNKIRTVDKILNFLDIQNSDENSFNYDKDDIYFSSEELMLLSNLRKNKVSNFLRPITSDKLKKITRQSVKKIVNFGIQTGVWKKKKMNNITRNKLRDYYQTEVNLLKESFNLHNIPWTDF